MSSFPAQAARVRDTTLAPRRRVLALRECLLRFAPYGFRATWHHLVVNADLPVWIEEDPDALLRAVDELEAARSLWLAEAGSYATARRSEKAAGRRDPRRGDSWRWMVQRLAFCPDPENHPTEPLATVLERLLTAYRTADAGEAPRCPACTAPRPTDVGAICERCGVWPWPPSTFPYNPEGARRPGPPTSSRPWPLIWNRLVQRPTTVGGGDIRLFRAEFTPQRGDQRFGLFQIYIGGVPVGDATTTALYPHIRDLDRLREEALFPGNRGPMRLPLGDTFDHLDVAMETTEQELIFTVATRLRWSAPPPWAPRNGRTLQLRASRDEIIKSCNAVEPLFKELLEHT